MAGQAFGLSGELRQAEAAALAEQLRSLLDGADAGSTVEIGLTDVTGIEFGPLQVLLCAATEAENRGLDLRVLAPAEGPLTAALTVHALDEALPLVPTSEAAPATDDHPKSTTSRGRRRAATQS